MANMPGEGTSLVARLERARHENADAPALTVSTVATKQTLTYRQLWDLAQEYAERFLRAGLGRGEVVCLFMHKGHQLVASMLGALLAGGVFAVLNEKCRWPQIREAQSLTGARLTLVDRSCLLHLDPSSTTPDEGPPLFEVGVGGALQERHAAALRGRGLVEPWTPPASPGRRPWRTIERDPACCLLTSGSSGRPKGVLISRGDLLQRAATEVVDFGLLPGDRLLSLLPFSFDVGLNQMLSCMLAGGELVILNSWLPADIASAVEAHRITGVSAVPTIWHQLLPVRDAVRGSLGSLRYVTVSAGPLDPQSLAAMRDLLPGAGIFKTYGQTEAFRSTILRPEEFTPEHWTTVGRAVDGCEVFVVGEDGDPLGPGQVGEIVHRGVGVMMRYLGDPTGTERKLRAAPQLTGGHDPLERVVFTGDAGVLDENGYLTILGRKDMMIKTSAYRVYPAEVEHRLLAHPAVAEAAVLGVPDAALGQRIVAVVVVRDERSGAAEEILTYARARLPSYMVPHEIVVRDELPRSATAKVLYETLRAGLTRGDST